MRFFVVFSLCLSFFGAVNAQDPVPGAARTEQYFPLLKGSSVAVVANATSVIGTTHLVDSLLRAGVHIIRIFAPEHGFRGTADAGEEFSSSTDPETGIPIVSLYGEKFKPSSKDLDGIDMMVFDIQDVGVRFFTYLSTLSYVMEACAGAHIPVLLLDRPNPNGFYVDGPVLEKKYRSFVGLHPVPIVYGMTIGEYARMINGEGWLKKGIRCQLTVIPCLDYDHSWNGSLPVRPSPNLPTQRSVLLYPSVCLFEGTMMNVGRGTDFPFEVFGCPGFPVCEIQYTPCSIPGMSKDPLYMGKECCGVDLRQENMQELVQHRELILDWLFLAYNKSLQKDSFFNSYFNTLAGTASLKEQIIAGWSASRIRKSWAGPLAKFMVIRKKYLLYRDFE